MAVANASRVVSKEDEFGPTEFYWRPHNMIATPSLLSRTEMIISLKTIQYLLDTCKPLLSDYERQLVRDFVISLAGSMVVQPDAHITISLCSDTRDAITELHEQTELYAVLDAMQSRKPGDRESSKLEPSNNHLPLTSQGMSPRNTQTQQTLKGASPPLPECHSDRELD